MGTRATPWWSRKSRQPICTPAHRRRRRGHAPVEVTANTNEAPGRSSTPSSSTAPAERRAQAVGANALSANPPSRGYREEMEHLAYCIRMRDQGTAADRATLQPRCPGRAAMADAIVALTANQAMKHRARIEFRAEWFDPLTDAVPDRDMVEHPVA